MRSRMISAITVCALSSGFANLAEATPYYNVTNLGVLDPSSAEPSLLDGQRVIGSASTGYYAFPQTVTSVTDSSTGAEWAGLPGVEGVQGTAIPQPTFFRMIPTSVNSSGAVIGGVPSGESRANPYSTLTLGYAQLLPSGQYGPFQPLINGMDHSLALSQANQILVIGADAKLVDLNAGTVSDVQSLVPPTVLARFPYLFPYAISDNGTILATATDSSAANAVTLLLSPSDQPLPIPIPEPSTFVVITAGTVGLLIRRRSHDLAH
ncbi:PEP-CTERM sorting domain-containing protein [Singulisphaera rosea]